MRILELTHESVSDARAMGVRFLARHFQRRAPTSCVPIKGIGPVILRNQSSDITVFRQIFRQGEYDLRPFAQWSSIQMRYREILQAGRRPLIIDAGANNGASAMWFAHQFDRAKVIAVEPEPASAQLCEQNTRRFGVEVIAAAIGSEPGSVGLINQDQDSYMVATERTSDGDVAVCTMADIIRRNSSECELFLVKIDIEGFESDLFASHTDWVRDAKVIIIEPHDWLYPGRRTSRNFQRVLADHDFDLLISGENLIYVRRDESNTDRKAPPRPPTALVLDPDG